MNAIDTAIYERTSANNYDPTRQLSDDEITELVKLATLSPSAFNLQNWRFVAIRTAEAKQKLLPLAYNQQKIVDAAVTFIVCGTLSPHEALPAALKPTLDAGIIDQATYDGWIGAAKNMYGNNPTFQRDEAIRSGAMATMTLMLAAQGRGLVSGPMIGFDPVAVAKAFDLGTNDVPVMLLAVGYPGSANWPQKPRKDVQEVLTLV